MALTPPCFSASFRGPETQRTIPRHAGPRRVSALPCVNDTIEWDAKPNGTQNPLHKEQSP